MKVTFDFARQQIILDGDDQHVVEVLVAARQIAPLLSQIQINTTSSAVSMASAPSSAKPPSGSNGETSQSGQPQHSGQTMKQFVRQLQLDNANERITAIAYYAKMYESKTSFTAKDMSDWLGYCGLSKPSQMSVVLHDCKRRSGFVDSAGHGQYKLTTQGDNLVIGKINQAEEAKK